MLDGMLEWIKVNGGGSGIIAASVAIVIFIATRLFEIFTAWHERRSTRRRIVIGLFREIKANVVNIESFLNDNPYPGDLRDKVKADLNFRPLLIIEESTQFYDSIASSLPELNSDCVIALSRFYEKLRTERAIGAAFESSAFPTLSVEGRASTVDDLWRSIRKAEKEGLMALYELELAYPRRWFTDFRSG